MMTLRGIANTFRQSSSLTRWIVGALVFVGIAGFAAVAEAIKQPDAPAVIEAATPTPVPSITVDVEGAVAAPGVRQLPDGSLVEAALAAAGGLTERADAVRVAKELNRADVLKDHQKVYVSSIGEAVGPPAGSANAQAVGEVQVINLNDADQAALESLPGIGAATAVKIIAYREANGGFQNIDELKEVPGIGEAKFEQLKDLVTV
jgi:competence protein ComEA